MRSRRAWLLSWLIFLALACAIPSAPTLTAVTLTPSLTPTVSAGETAENCYFVEASETLPESAAIVRQAVEATGVVVEDVTVRGDGENYVCPKAGTSRFGARAAFVTLTIQVKDVNDKENLGDSVEKILGALGKLTYEQLPNWSSGEITLIAVAGEQQARLEIPGLRGLNLREQGLAGAVLWEALSQPPCQNTTTYKKLDDLSTQIQSALQTAGLTQATTYAEQTGLRVYGSRNERGRKFHHWADELPHHVDGRGSHGQEADGRSGGSGAGRHRQISAAGGLG